MGFFDKLKEGLRKTKAVLNTDIRDLFKSEGRLVDEKFLDEIYTAIIKTDMGVPAAKETVEEIGTNYRARVVEMNDVIDVIKRKWKTLMAQDAAPIRFAESGPTVIMVCGVNGAGKTTSIAKLTQMFKSQGKSVLLGAGDTFRAAAVEQLTIWAGRLGAEVLAIEEPLLRYGQQVVGRPVKRHARGVVVKEHQENQRHVTHHFLLRRVHAGRWRTQMRLP